MRHRLFLAVLLSLALGLLKETTAATGGEESKTSTTASTTSETPESNNETVTTPAPSVNTTSKSPGSKNKTVATPAPSVNTTSEPPGSKNETVATPAPSVNTTSKPSGSKNETVATPAPSVNTTSEPPDSNNETVATPAPSVNTTSEPSASNNETVATPAPSVNTTSKPPDSNNETVATPAPSVNTTSEPPESKNETVATPAPSVNTTSEPSGSKNETVATPAPSVNTTSEPPDSNNETVATPAPSVNTTPEPPGSNNETVATPAPPVNTTSKPPEDFCSTEPCGRNFAKCVPLKSSYICQCEFGFYYSKESKNCYKGEVYPGLITVKAYYNDSVENVNSTEYEEVFNRVSEFFQKALTSLPGYVETVIVKIKPQKEIRAADPQTDVTVINLFKENSDVTNNSVSDAVIQAIKENSSYVSSYKEVTQCDVFQCDTRTTECVEEPVLECKCKNDLGKINEDDHSCLVCNKSCSAQVNKYCTIKDGIPACTCMTNFEFRDGKCTACQVGYSGENCTDNTELILIIVGTVLGAVILTLVIAVSIISARAKGKQNPEKKRLIKSGYSDTDISDDRPTMMFPRVQTTSGHANPGYQPNNPYEMPSTKRGHFSEAGFDDLYEPSQERGGFRMRRY